MSDLATYPLRLPRSIRAGVDMMSKRDGTSINQFVSVAVAEKLAMMRAETYYTERSARANLDVFDQIMSRPGADTPRAGDELGN